tara:strand:- start:893 stop:1093 length:201 start_codon:yes stop_codon:yes gene_type:complete
MRIFDSSVKNDIMKYSEPITDRFIYFLHYLRDEKHYNGRDIINVVAKPYKYNNEFNQFCEEEGYNG